MQLCVCEFVISDGQGRTSRKVEGGRLGEGNLEGSERMALDTSSTMALKTFTLTLSLRNSCLELLHDSADLLRRPFIELIKLISGFTFS